jgi:hypothetical protein
MVRQADSGKRAVLRPQILKAVLLSAVAGWLAIDVCMSVVYILHGLPAIELFQWDASNVLGSAAFSGGVASATLGLFLDLVVSIGWGALCTLLMTRLALAWAHPAWFGTLFGAFVMYVMIWVVVPLGRAHNGTMTLTSFLTVLVGHTLFFGIPVALTVRRVADGGRP